MTIEKIVLDSIKTVEKDLFHNEKRRKFSDDYNSLVADAPESSSNSIRLINAHSRNKRLNIMVVGAALGLVVCLLILTSYKRDLPGEVVGIISTVSGIFGACLKDAYSFEFGSSRGSKEKDDKISTTILEKMSFK